MKFGINHVEMNGNVSLFSGFAVHRDITGPFVHNTERRVCSDTSNDENEVSAWHSVVLAISQIHRRWLCPAYESEHFSKRNTSQQSLNHSGSSARKLCFIVLSLDQPQCLA